MKRMGRRTRWLGILGALLLVLTAWSIPAGATARYWIGKDGLWSSADNWYEGFVPKAHDDATLSLPGKITLDSDYHNKATTGLGNLTIGSDSGDVVFNHSENTLYIGDGTGFSQPENPNRYSLVINGSKGYSATYNLSGDGVLVKECYEVKIGTDGLGSFNQSGGTFQLSGAMYLGDQATGHGVYTMTGGSIEAGPTGLGGIALGEWGGTGDFLHSGGSVTIGNLELARQEGSIGKYELSRTGVLSTTATLVGLTGTGTFNQTGGSHLTDWLVLGEKSGSVGAYGFNTGTSGESNNGSLSVSGGEHIGVLGTGTFTQGTGTHTVGGELVLGAGVGGAGTFDLNGGSLTVSGMTYVGMGGTGTFHQTGGTFETIYDLNIGQSTGSIGTYSLSEADNSNPAFLGVGQNLNVGLEGTGTFTQTGGTVAVGEGLIVGQNSPKEKMGEYLLTGGSATSERIHVGTGAPETASYGKFVQTGGTNATDELVLGYTSRGVGTYELSNGASLTVSDALVVGLEGTGTFTQTGGTVTAGQVSIAADKGSTGTYNIQGGTLTATEVTINAGGVLSGSGTVIAPVNVTGGTVAPGNSPGTLTVTGDYTQGEGGTLAIELGAEGYDILKVSGTASLAGILKIDLYEGYTPVIGSIYDILFAKEITGKFDSVLGPSGYTWDVAYLDGTVHLTANAVPIPGAVWLFAPALGALIGARRKVAGLRKGNRSAAG